jgi:hypothetical protein
LFKAGNYSKGLADRRKYYAKPESVRAMLDFTRDYGVTMCLVFHYNKKEE